MTCSLPRIALLALLAAASCYAQNIFTIAGIPYTHRNSVDSQLALNAPLGSVYGLLIDKVTGRLLFNDESLIVRFEPDGSLLALAGTGPQSFLTQLLGSSLNPATVPASILRTGVLRGMAEDNAGALYVSDAAFGYVYRIAPDGTASIFAGGGTHGPGDGGPATAALLESPRGLVFDSKGNLDIAEVFCNCIRQVTPAGIISTPYVAPPSPVSNRLPNIEGLTIDAQDNLYFTEWFGDVVMKVAPGGSATTIAGTGAAGFSGDGGQASAAQLNGPSGVTLDAAGNLYLADTLNQRIRKVAPDGIITTIAGTGTCGFSGDGGPALTAGLCSPAQTLFDNSGNLLIADYGNRRVRAMTADGTIVTIAGSGVFDVTPNSIPGGDGGPVIHATFLLLGGAAFDSAGNLYVSDALANNIRRISFANAVSTIAGTGQSGYAGDGGPAVQAQLFHPGPLAVGPDGALFMITGDSRVRKITGDGIIHLVAGTGTGTGLIRDQGDGGPAVQATLNEPGAVAFDQQGNIYIADTSNGRVRKIDTSGIINTIGPTGQQGVDYYNSVAIDPHGNIYVAWTHSLPAAIYSTVNRLNPDGSFTRVAGTGESCTNGPGQFTGDGLPATQVRLCAVTSMTMGPDGLLYLSEGGYSLLLRLNADGTIQRVAGNTAALYPGDGGPALQASLRGTAGFSPEAVTFDPAGAIYIPEPGLNIIRKLVPTPYIPFVFPERLDVGAAATQTISVTGNFAEPFPYQVRVSTEDGGSWLQTNRVTGLAGEPFTAAVRTEGLGHGTHRGTIAALFSVPLGATPIEVDIPVTLTVP